jgi:predicted nucleic acid-binding protein
MKVLVDSNIFLDLYFNRNDGIKPLGEFAFNFFKETISCKYSIILINAVLHELKEKLEIDEEKLFETILKELKNANKIEVIVPEKNELNEARKISKEENVPKTDCLLAVMSKKLNAPIISRDFHLRELETETFLPEEL